eukprot:c20263_g1_i1.p1 GENE.c20263_g1_i1~~c20263_g1_i1.p1  ORF type:complete len:178 (+),score=16.50 c20263_g1_i1:1054-1587(+)
MTRCKWTPEEDATLQTIMRSLTDTTSGPAIVPCWRVVARMLNTGKSSRQCRERWRVVLDPHINRRPWTVVEDEMLQQKIQEFGPKWSALAALFPGRTGTAVKNRYVTLNRRHRHSHTRTHGSPATRKCSPPEEQKAEFSQRLVESGCEEDDSVLPLELRRLCWTIQTPLPSVIGLLS